MLKRRYTIQKSIRFDERLADDLEFLAKQLDRTQNDLVNIAVEDLILENKYYFARLVVVDNLFDYFEGGDDRASFEVDGLKVEVFDKENLCIADIKLYDDQGVLIESFTRTEEDAEKLYQYIIEYTAMHIDGKSPRVQEFLKKRLDYK